LKVKVGKDLESMVLKVPKKHNDEHINKEENLYNEVKTDEAKTPSETHK
jgi:hypothetical protein